MLNFPFETKRPGQQELMDKITSCLENKKHLLVHAPTGIGKTVSALYPTLNFAKEKGLTVFYLTPRHSQHTIALNALKKMGDVKVTDMVGKLWLCNYLGEDMIGSDFHEICNFLKKDGKCAYYNNVITKGELTESAQKKINALSGSILAADELKEQCAGLCPYEISCFLARRSDVIIGDYFHLFNPYIADTFLAKINKKLENSIVIVDEAHQLPSRVRDLISSKLTEYVLDKAAQEAKEFKSAIYGDIMGLQSRIHNEMRVLLGFSEEAYLQKDDLSNIFRQVGAEFLDELKLVSDQAKEAGKKKSFCASLAKFIEEWIASNDSYARVAKRVKAYGGDRYEIRLTALMPSLVSGGVISETHSTILMSATLQPLKMYGDLLGVPNYETILLRSSFPRENRLNIIAPIATTRYAQRGEDQYRTYAGAIEKICSNLSGNVAAFFPSYAFMQQVERLLDHQQKFIEDAEQSKDQKAVLLNQFILSDGGLLLGVQGGSFDQGIDFPNNVLKGVVIAGISLAKPDLETKSLIECYDKQYGKGMEYGYLYPAVQKAIQASGRAIRKESDKAVIVYLDERFTWSNYRPVFADHTFVVSKEPWEKLKEMEWN
ncbi:MAG: ATP-dependent DNA helicase [Candidatus Aenigmarchaeota archaeon]|nr:ATP-dependent DNA helicase [Candidatus Aenigmarchaeota archaeon]